MPDRRQEPRFAPDHPVRAEVRALDGTSPVLAGLATDLSGGGLRVALSAPVPIRPDQAVLVRLLHDDDEPELIEATVRRVIGEDPVELHLRADVLSYLDGEDAARMRWRAS
jgi:hypothetical protein